MCWKHTMIILKLLYINQCGALVVMLNFPANLFHWKLITLLNPFYCIRTQITKLKCLSSSLKWESVISLNTCISTNIIKIYIPSRFVCIQGNFTVSWEWIGSCLKKGIIKIPKKDGVTTLRAPKKGDFKHNILSLYSPPASATWKVDKKLCLLHKASCKFSMWWSDSFSGKSVRKGNARTLGRSNVLYLLTSNISEKAFFSAKCIKGTPATVNEVKATWTVVIYLFFWLESL